MFSSFLQAGIITVNIFENHGWNDKITASTVWNSVVNIRPFFHGEVRVVMILGGTNGKSVAGTVRFDIMETSESILFFVLRTSFFQCKNLFGRFDILLHGRVVSTRDFTSTDLSSASIVT